MNSIVTSSGAISPARARLDRHVADGHPPFHRQRRDGRPVVFDHMPRGTSRADLADDRQDDVLGLKARAQPARHLDPQRVRPSSLPERLSRQDVLDLAGTDTKSQRTKGPVGTGVAVAADDRRARQCHPQLGTDHMHNPLMTTLNIVERDAELTAIGPHRLDLLPRQGVANIKLIVGGDVMVDGGERQLRPPHAPARQPEPIERLRTGHFVNQVPIDVQERRLVGRRHDVAIPHFFKQCFGHLRFGVPAAYKRTKPKGLGRTPATVSGLPIRHAKIDSVRARARATTQLFSHDNFIEARPATWRRLLKSS